MIKIIETSTSEREEEFHQKYNEFKHYYTNTDMLMKDIWQRVGLTPTCSTGRRIREQLRHDGHDPFSRGQKLKKSSMLLESLPDIQRELRNGGSIDETLRKHNMSLHDAVFNMEKPNVKPMRRSRYSSVDSKYIYKQGRHFLMQKSVNGRSYNFGTYRTLEDAERVRDYFLENGWRHGELDKVCRILGVERSRK